MDPDSVCPERLDPDPVCPERLDPDPVNIRPDPKPWQGMSCSEFGKTIFNEHPIQPVRRSALAGHTIPHLRSQTHLKRN